MTSLTVARLAEGLTGQTGALADVATGLAPDLVVPDCPEWRVRDLVGHVGTAHRRAAGIVRTGEATPLADPVEVQPGPLPQWLREGAAELVAAVEATGPDTQVWTFAGPAPARFWLRRMLHDTVIHHADAARAAGTPFTLDDDLAVDCLGEFLDLLCLPGFSKFKPALAELRGDGQTLQLRPADSAIPGWLITRHPDGAKWQRATADADVVVTAPLHELLLIAYRRREPAAARVSGKHSLLTHWLAHTMF